MPSCLLLHHRSMLLLFLPLLHPRLSRLDAVLPLSSSSVLLCGMIQVVFVDVVVVVVVVRLGLLTQEWCRVGELLGRQELDPFVRRRWVKASVGDVAGSKTLFVRGWALCAAAHAADEGPDGDPGPEEECDDDEAGNHEGVVEGRHCGRLYRVRKVCVYFVIIERFLEGREEKRRQYVYSGLFRSR